MTVVLMVLAPRACWRGADSLWKVELPLQRSLLTCPRSHHSISPRAPQVASVIGPDRWVPSPCIVRMLCRQEKQTRKIMQQFGGSRRLWMTSLPSMIQTKVFVVRGERVRRGSVDTGGCAKVWVKRNIQSNKLKQMRRRIRGMLHRRARSFHKAVIDGLREGQGRWGMWERGWSCHIHGRCLRGSPLAVSYFLWHTVVDIPEITKRQKKQDRRIGIRSEIENTFIYDFFCLCPKALWCTYSCYCCCL